MRRVLHVIRDVVRCTGSVTDARVTKWSRRRTCRNADRLACSRATTLEPCTQCRSPALAPEHPVLGRARRRGRRCDHRRLELGRVRLARRQLRGADVRDHRRLSPLLLASHVQDQPRVPVRPRAARDDERAEGRAVVGRAPPQPPQVLRRARGHPLAACSAASGGRTSAGSSAAAHARDRLDRIKDFAKYPELRWLDRHDLLVAIAWGFVLYLVGGSTALFWGHFLSLVLAWHVTFCINSLAHVWGRRRYDDDRRLAQQPGARPAHVRRGLAQQPPPLPALRAPGLLLVGDRRHATTCSRSSRSCGSSRTSRRPGPHPGREGRAGTRARRGRALAGDIFCRPAVSL